MTKIAYNVYKADCPTRKALDHLSDKWTTLIIGLLDEKPYRFSELLRGIDGISQKMLTQTLRKNERDGLIERKVDSSKVPISVTYRLTNLGRSVTVPLESLRVWAETNIEKVTRAQTSYDRAVE